LHGVAPDRFALARATTRGSKDSMKSLVLVCVSVFAVSALVLFSSVLQLLRMQDGYRPDVRRSRKRSVLSLLRARLGFHDSLSMGRYHPRSVGRSVRS
jgi:hypothetical protein